MANKEILLLDHVGSAELILMESTKSGRCRFGGIFQEAETVNKNKRKYPKHILENNVTRLQESIDKGGLLGHLDHPSTSIIELSECALKILKLEWDGNILHGIAETIESPNGRILKSLLESGIPIGLSSRSVGAGDTGADGVFVVNDSLRVITWDAVADPSVGSAYQKVISSNHNESAKISQPVLKNENTSINKLNVNTLISYFGQLVNEKSKLIKEGLNND